jgi:hypothetical protein
MKMNKTIKSVTGPVVAATTLVGVCALLLEPTLAQAEQLTMVTKPYKEVIIRGYARWNSNCDAIQPPQISLDVPPQNGFVCARPTKGTVRIVREGKAGHCVGQKVLGIELVYLPRSKFTGVDRIRYTVKFKDVTHAVDAEIGITSDKVTTESGAIAPSAEAPQSQGPVPECAPLVS